MAKYPCEMFGNFFYNPTLTYDHLHELEANLLRAVDPLLNNEGAAHLDFTPRGDGLRLQCEFSEFEPAFFARLAKKLSDLIIDDTQARLLFVDKEEMGKLYIFYISKSNYEQGVVKIKPPQF